MSETWLVTGGAGFIGRAVVEELLVEADGPEVVVLDALTYAAHPGALRRLGGAGRLRVVEGDVADPDAVSSLVASCLPAVILHLASETHVDRSIRDVAPFVRTNVQGAWVVANAALGVDARLVQVSTDEVYGDRSGCEPAREGDPVSPSNPYAATKACGDAMVQSLVRAHGLDAVVTRGVNTFGPGQFPEKLLPLAERRWAQGWSMPVYGDGLQQREWIHVRDHARGILAAARRGVSGSVVHLGGELRSNLQVLEDWRRELGFGAGLGEAVEHVADRPGHDRCYRLEDASSRKQLGWQPQVDWGSGLAEMARWSSEHPTFWDEAMARPEVRRWFSEQYA